MGALLTGSSGAGDEASRSHTVVPVGGSEGYYGDGDNGQPDPADPGTDEGDGPDALSWLALGDSFQSGAGDEGRDGDDRECARGGDAPPRAGADALELEGWEVDLTFQACIGAQLGPDGSSSPSDLPDQIEEARVHEPDGGYDVVSLGIGGNDAGWMDVLSRCWNAYFAEWTDRSLDDPDPLDDERTSWWLEADFSTGCWRLLDDWDVWRKQARRSDNFLVHDQWSIMGASDATREDLFAVFEEELLKYMGLRPAGDHEAELPEMVGDAVGEVRDEFEPELVVLVEYPTLFPEAPPGTWSRLADSTVDQCYGVHRPFVNAFHNAATELNQMYHDIAAGRDDVIVASVAEVYDGHNLCEDEPWINGPDIGTDELHEQVPLPVPTITRSFHPDNVGEQVVGARLAAEIHEHHLATVIDPEARHPECPEEPEPAAAGGDWRHPDEPAVDLARSLRERTAEVCFVHREGADGFGSLNVPDGVGFLDSSQAIYKLLTGSPTFDTDGARRIENEGAAWRLDRLLGFNLVATTITWYGPDGPGMLQERVVGVEEMSPGVAATAGSQNDYTALEQQYLAVFDYVLWNLDRSRRNFMTGPEGELVAIDHELAFPVSTDVGGVRSYFTDAYAGRTLDESVLTRIRRVEPAAVARVLRLAGLPEDAVQGAARRFDEVRTEGTIPAEVGFQAWLADYELPIEMEWQDPALDDWYELVPLPVRPEPRDRPLVWVRITDGADGTRVSSVRAVVDGEVMHPSDTPAHWIQDPECPNGIVIASSGTPTERYFYCDVADLSVEPGDSVTAGERIGDYDPDAGGFRFGVRYRTPMPWTDWYCPIPLLDALAAEEVGEDRPEAVMLSPRTCA